MCNLLSKLVKSIFVTVLALATAQALTLPALAQGPIYVTPTGAGNSDGSSWGNAATLQHALSIAQSGYEIWVASGVYTPGVSRTDTFTLTSGIALYGGFAGNETSRDQRDWVNNATILSGDISGDDTNTDGNSTLAILRVS